LTANCPTDGTSLEFSNAAFESHDRSLSPIAHTEFAQNAVDMSFYRTLGNSEGDADFLIALARSHLLQYEPFAIGQFRHLSAFGQPRTYSRRNVIFARTNLANRAENLLRRGIFEQVRLGTRPQSPVDIFISVISFASPVAETKSKLIGAFSKH